MCILILVTFKKRDPNIRKSYLFGFPLFSILIGLQRAILIYHDYYAPDNQDMVLILIANSMILSAFIVFNYTLESNVYTKTHHFFTLIGIIFIILYLIFLLLDKLASTIVLYAAIFSQVIPIIGIYIIVARNSQGNAKKRALIILLGIIVLLISQSTGLFMLVGLMDRISSTAFAPPVSLVSIVILGYGFLRDPN